MRTKDKLSPLPQAGRHYGPHLDHRPGCRLRRPGAALVRLRGSQHPSGSIHLRRLHVHQEGHRELERAVVRLQRQERGDLHRRKWGSPPRVAARWSLADAERRLVEVVEGQHGLNECRKHQRQALGHRRRRFGEHHREGWQHSRHPGPGHTVAIRVKEQDHVHGVQVPGQLQQLPKQLRRKILLEVKL